MGPGRRSGPQMLKNTFGVCLLTRPKSLALESLEGLERPQTPKWYNKLLFQRFSPRAAQDKLSET